METSHLASNSDKVNPSTFFQMFFNLAEHISQITLKIFGTTKLLEVGQRFYTYMLQLEIVIESRSIHDAALFDYPFCQSIKGSSACALHALMLVLHIGRIYGTGLIFINGVLDRTNLLAQTAIDTQVLCDDRIQETFVIPFHRDALLGAGA